VSREAHAPFCEGLRGKIPRPTHLGREINSIVDEDILPDRNGDDVDVGGAWDCGAT